MRSNDEDQGNDFAQNFPHTALKNRKFQTSDEAVIHKIKVFAQQQQNINSIIF
jgi:hypothetical protein